MKSILTILKTYAKFAAVVYGVLAMAWFHAWLSKEFILFQWLSFGLDQYSRACVVSASHGALLVAAVAAVALVVSATIRDEGNRFGLIAAMLIVGAFAGCVVIGVSWPSESVKAAEKPKPVWIQNPDCLQGDYCFKGQCMHASRYSETMCGEGYTSAGNLCIRGPELFGGKCKP